MPVQSNIFKSLICIVLFIVLVCPANAQHSNILKGKVIDESNDTPVPFATIAVMGENYGVITNEDGSFSLPVDKVSGNDTLRISSLGYKTVKVAVSSFTDGVISTIVIPQQYYSIKEVLVKGKKVRRLPARKMMLKAVSLLEKNYPVDSFLIDAYYRDYMKVNDKYVNLYEAHVEIEDMGFESDDYKTSHIRLINGGFNPDFEIDKTMIMGYDDQSIKKIPNGILRYKGGNELAILRLVDPLRNRDDKTIDYVNNIRTDFCKHHTFWFEDVVYIEERPVYKLGFRSKPEQLDLLSTQTGSFNNLGVQDEEVTARAEGSVFIDAETYSILNIKYQVYVSDWFHGEYKIWELAVEYKMINNTAQLSYLSYNNAVEFPDYSDDSYFYLENIVFDRQNKRVGLEFNNWLDESSVHDARFCSLIFNNRKIEFDSLDIKGNFVYLYTDKYKETFSGKPITDTAALKIRIKKIKDIKGNVYGKYNYETAYQYRELFVRDIEFEYDPVDAGDVLDKMQPMVIFQDSTDTEISREYFNSPLIGKFQ